MKVYKKLLLTALGLSLSVASFADKQPSLVQQMWRFAYPSYTIPKYIPLNAKRAVTPRDHLIFTDKDGDYYETIAIKSDYGNGHLLLHTHFQNEEGMFSDEIVAFKDSKGKYTLFKSDVSYLKGYGIGECTIYPQGRSFISNKPLQKIFPKITIQTFSPNTAIKSVKAPLFYLDVTFPRKGTTVTATIKPLGHLLNMDNPTHLLYGNLRNEQGYPDNLRYLLIDWAKQLSNKQSVNALINGQPLNSEDEKVLVKMLQAYAGSYSDMTQEEAKEKVLKLLRWQHQVYTVEKNLKFNRIVLAWDRKLGRFHIANKIPAKKFIASSFYDYFINLPELEDSYTCFDENSQGYGYMQ